MRAVRETSVPAPGVALAGRSGPHAFAAFRILLGLALALQLAAWFPHAAELFSKDGIPSLGAGGLAGVLPSPFPAEPAVARAWLAGMGVLSLALAAGVWRPTAAVLLWYGWVCLGHAAPQTQTVAAPFLGWLLLASALVPPGEPWRPFGRSPARPEGGRVPRALFVGAWVVLAAGYGLAGFDKLASPGWRQGDALSAAAGLPYAREWAAQLLFALPRGLQRAATWAGLGVELVFPLLALFRATRPLAWAMGVGLQLALLALFAFPGLTVGMLVMHAFTFDPAWAEAIRARLSRGNG